VDVKGMTATRVQAIEPERALAGGGFGGLPRAISLAATVSPPPTRRFLGSVANKITFCL